MARLAPPLRRLRDDNLNIKWGNRPREWDGWIGDAAHQQRESDHNENERGVVDATDTDTTQPPAPKTPIHVPTVIASMIVHPCTHYVIHKRRIMTAANKFRPAVYTGTNHHDKHIHCSCFQTVAAENSAIAWRFILKPPAWGVLKKGSKTSSVRELQAFLIGWGYSLAADSDFGPATDAIVRRFQAAHGLKVDGIVGAKTRYALRPFS